MKRGPAQWTRVRLWLLLGVLLSMLALAHAVKTKTIDYASLEKSWEVGDDDDELRTQGDEHYRQLSGMSEEEAKAVGPQMLFVTLRDGDGRPREPLADVASRWKQMLWSGSVEVNIYEVEESKLLVGLQKGIFVQDVQQFLREQSEVKEYEWNGNTYSTSSMHHHTDRKHEKTRRRNQAKRVKKADDESVDTSNGKVSHRRKKRKHGKRDQTTPTAKATGTHSNNHQQPLNRKEEL